MVASSLGQRLACGSFISLAVVRTPLCADVNCEQQKLELVAPARNLDSTLTETSLPRGVRSPFFSFQIQSCFLLPHPQF